VIAGKAKSIVLISPHAPLKEFSFVAYTDSRLHGDFSRFGAPTVTLEAALDEELLEAISRVAANEGYAVYGIKGNELDHGTLVPLYFLQRFGWRGPIVALGYNFLSNEDHMRFGASIRHAAETLQRPIAFVASGDLSHRLTHAAPAGYFPDAYLFDEEVVSSIAACNPSRIVGINQDLRRAAGECGYRSLLVAFGAIEKAQLNCEVLNYEAPFGVGYLVAQLLNSAIDQADSDRT
jgi:AmmeMemoRadiSam system protein B